MGWEAAGASGEMVSEFWGVGVAGVDGVLLALLGRPQFHASICFAACGPALASSGAVVADGGRLGGVAEGDAGAAVADAPSPSHPWLGSGGHGKPAVGPDRETGG